MNKKTDIEKISKLRGISKEVINSVDRNIRACYPQKTEKEIESMVIKNIMNNLDSCMY